MPRSKLPAAPRRPGRPSATEATGDLRERLLDAAIACFCRKGIEGTTLRAIAREAGANPALLHYYFGDKLQLQAAVVTERVLPAVAILRERLLANGDDVAGLVAGFIDGVYAAVDRNPWLPSLWVREVLSEGGALREVMLQHIAPQVPALLAARFARAREEGELGEDLDPRLLVVSLVGLTIFPLASQPIWRRLFGAEDVSFADLRRHTLALLDRGLGLPS